jgi:hypothetical protein
MARVYFYERLMRREIQNPLISSQILSPFLEQSSLAPPSPSFPILGFFHRIAPYSPA